ncbi:MAG: hypothetical protein L7F77_15335 [Candidatus Magnetominusculus sp. LBB02]|nr:hypothetical protein [Candidatus Magnetominusculus sp. LBB02]
MKKIIVMSLLALSVQSAYAWYSDCNATSPRDTSFSAPGSAFPGGSEQYCGMTLFRVKKEADKPAEAELLKGNFDEALKDAPKKSMAVEVEKK